MTAKLAEAPIDPCTGTIELVRAYVTNAHTSITADELQTLIRETFATLTSLQKPTKATKREAPALHRVTEEEIRNSIGETELISFEDGNGYASLSRHLKSLGLTPARYRRKWGLPDDYPMVHPALKAERAAVAEAMRRAPPRDEAPVVTPAAVPVRGRKPRASKV